MALLRAIVRTYLSVGRTLPAPWNHVMPAVLLGATYLIAVRILWPYMVRVGRAALITVISASAFLLLLPDLVSTSVRRSRGRQPAAWTFSIGDGILRTQGRWVEALQEIKPKRKEHTRLAIIVIAAAALLPVGAFYGAKSQTNLRLRSDSTNVLNWYTHLDHWARK